MPDDAGAQVAIARLGRPHGLRGGITAHADGPTLGSLVPGECVTVRVGGGDRTLVVGERRGEGPKAILVFAGIATREDAAALSGGTVMVAPDRLPPPEGPDTFYVRDLIGFEVRCSGTVVGTVRDVLPGTANDCLVVAGDGGEILLPFTRDAVVQVDEAAACLILREGLL